MGRTSPLIGQGKARSSHCFFGNILVAVVVVVVVAINLRTSIVPYRFHLDLSLLPRKGKGGWFHGNNERK